MYKNEFDKVFQNQLFYGGYLFHGEDDYLVEEYAYQTAKKIAQGEDITKYYFEEYNFDNAYNFLVQSSLFSNTNILFLKIAKKIPKKELDRLIEACTINPDSKIVIAALGESDFRSMESSFNKKSNSLFVRFYKLKDSEAISFLKQQVATIGLEIDMGTLEFLYNMHQKNLGLCVSDLKKLSILNKPINPKTISLHCFGLGSVDMNLFLEKLLSKQAIGKDLYNLLEEGISEVYLVGRITQYVQMLFMVNSYLKLNGELNIKEIWGYALPKSIAQNYANMATRFKLDQFSIMLNHLSALELELKSGKIIDINGYTQASLRNFLK